MFPYLGGGTDGTLFEASRTQANFVYKAQGFSPRIRSLKLAVAAV